MMDLLVQITTAHKLSPGSHAIHAIGDRGVLPYKPSTPIGEYIVYNIGTYPMINCHHLIAKRITQ